MKIVFCNQKGGSGKTTAVMLLAYAYAAAGQSVGIIDRDPQQTAAQWLEDAPADGVEIAQPGAEYSMTLIDTPPSLADPGLARGLKDADRVIIVSSTSPVDVYSSRRAVDFIRERRPDIRPALLFSRYKSHTAFGKGREVFAKALGLRALKRAIPEREAIQRAALDGYRALPAAERENIANLAIEILRLKP